MSKLFTDNFLWSSDNVRIQYRDYPGGTEASPAILCLPGLTRNLRDFEALAERLSPRFRVLTPSLRGRGDSGYARDPLTYVPLTYLQDMGRLIEQEQLSRIIIIGTSLGGLIGLLLDVTQRQKIAGLILNDVGPSIEAAGLARIRDQLGKGGNWLTWLEAARDIAKKQADIYPGWELEQWLAHAKRLCRVSREGRIVWDYDPQIAAPFNLPHADNNAQGALDLWLALDGYKDRPVLSIRGELSDILSIESQRAMQQRLPTLTTITIPNVGHVPTLEEPEALAAIEAYIEGLL